MKKLLLGILTILVFIAIAGFLYFQLSDCGIAPWGCGDYPSKQDIATQKITVGEGPEDMAIDISTGSERIIVSCSDRRNKDPKNGGFYQINPETNTGAPLKIIPSNLAIFPHGIDVVKINEHTYLYAISHHRKGMDTEHKIFRFIIEQDTLVQDETYILEDPILTGPNDIDVLNDGSFYVSNPLPSNNKNESTKAILGFKNGNVLHYDGKANWTTVVEDMCYPNGVWFDQKSDRVVVANGGCKTVESFGIKNGEVHTDNKLTTSKFNLDIPIGDNLLMDNRGVLWIAAHPCPLKFLGHANDIEAKSPVQIFAIDPSTMKANLVFQNNGDLISAASTAIRIEDRLYLSQVFDPFVLVVDGVDF